MLAKAVEELLRAEQNVKRASAALYRAESTCFGRWNEGHELSIFEHRLRTARERQERAEYRVESLCIELGIIAPLPKPSLTPDNS